MCGKEIEWAVLPYRVSGKLVYSCRMSIKHNRYHNFSCINYISMCSPHNAAHFDTRLGVSDTRRFGVAHGTFAHTDFSRSASCWTLVHGQRCQALAGEFPTGFLSDSGGASSPVSVPPSSSLCPVSAPTQPSPWPGNGEIGRFSDRGLARFSDIRVSKRPKVGVGQATWPHVTSEALGNDSLSWHRLELKDIRNAPRNYRLLRKYWRKKYWKKLPVNQLSGHPVQSNCRREQ